MPTSGQIQGSKIVALFCNLLNAQLSICSCGQLVAKHRTTSSSVLKLPTLARRSSGHCLAMARSVCFGSLSHLKTFIAVSAGCLTTRWKIPLCVIREQSLSCTVVSSAHAVETAISPSSVMLLTLKSTV